MQKLAAAMKAGTQGPLVERGKAQNSLLGDFALTGVMSGTSVRRGPGALLSKACSISR
jgi:hypothetical protein